MVYLRAETERLQKALKRDGAIHVARSLVARLADSIRDRKRGIQAGGLIPIESLVGKNREFHDYFPTSTWAFRGLMQKLPRDAFQGRFVDIGCGLGRTLIMAADYPFPAITGIEISEQLVKEARHNVKKALPAKKLPAVSVIAEDATQATIADDATVIYFYNPFRRQVLAKALEKVAESIARSPRKAYVVFNNTRHVGEIENRLAWLRPVERLRFEHPCAIYEVRARS